MFIETVPNRKSPPCILLRETYRQDGKVRHRTLANLTNWPQDIVEGFRSLLGRRRISPSAEQPATGSFKITRSLPHGHVSAVFSAMRTLGVAELLGSRNCTERKLCLAMIAERILSPGSKLATSRHLSTQTRNTIIPDLAGAPGWQQDTEPTPLQKKALDHIATLKKM
jgi:hypothetical protein